MKTSHRIALVGATALGMLVVAAAPASASSSGHRHHVHVVRPGHSIQDAVDAAHPGDTIVLKRGSYDGGILVSTNRLTIVGAGPSTVLRDTGTNHCLNFAGPTGICVADPSQQTTVRGVTIKNLTVRGFDAFGIFGFGTDRLSVSGVHAIDNAEYGIAEFNSTRGVFVRNLAAGSTEEAGLYVGDIANAHNTLVKDNVSVGNALGILVRHAHNVTVTGNRFIGNCAGVALVDDGQPGGQGDTRLTRNVISHNNESCPPSEEAPPLEGTGVIIFGGHHNTIRGNQIIGNRGTVDVSGGVFLAPGSTNNLIVKNTIRGSRPADIVDASGNDTNKFVNNRCRTSVPDLICAYPHSKAMAS